MRIPALISLALLLCCQGRAATIYFDIADFTTSPSTFKTLKMAPASMPSVSGTNIIVKDSRQQNTTGWGRVTFTNVVEGTYDCTFTGINATTTFQITVTNYVGSINAKDIITVSTNSVYGLNAYSMSSADQRFVRSLYSNGVLVGHSPYISIMPGTNMFIGMTNAGGTNYFYIASTATAGGGNATNAQPPSATLTNLANTSAITNVVSSFGVKTSDILYPAANITATNVSLTGWLNVTGGHTNEGASRLNGSVYVDDWLTVTGPQTNSSTIFADALWSGGAISVLGDSFQNTTWLDRLTVTNHATINGRATNNGVTTFGTVTASRAAIFDANNGLTNSVTTSAELAFVNGVTSAIQTQLNNRPTFSNVAGSNYFSASISDQFDDVTEKTVPAGTDLLIIEDQAASLVKKRIQIESMESALEGVIDIPDLQGQAPTAKIADDAVTFAKMQNSTDTRVLIGRNSSGAGDFQEVSLTQLLDWIGSAAAGDILYRGASTWARLPIGTSGQVLSVSGGGLPQWATGGGGGGSQTPWGSNIDGDGYGLDELNYLIRNTTNLVGTLPDLVVQGPQVIRYFPTNNWMINIVKPSNANKGASFTLHIFNTNDPPYSGIVSNAFGAAGQELYIVGATNSIIKGEWDGTNVTVGSWHARNPVSDTAFSSAWNGDTTNAPSKNADYDYAHLTDTDDDGFPNVLDSTITGGTFSIGSLYVTNASRFNQSTNAGAATFESTIDVAGAASFTGSLTASSTTSVPTASADDNDNSIASTAFVQTEINGVTNFVEFCLSDEVTALSSGNSKVTWRAPHAMTIVALRASVSTNSTSGVVTFDINKSGSTILSTKLTIDANEKTSVTAATAYVLSSTTFSDDEEITFDQDTAGTGAVGAKVKIYYKR